MPLMRIRSVEIVFEDEMSTYTDTGLLDRSMELIVSDSDDSTRCVDDLEHLQVERDDDSITLNAEADLSDDNSFSSNAVVSKHDQNVKASDDTRELNEPVTLATDDNTLSLNVSELGDSGRFTEEASSSHVEVPLITYDDAVLSHSFDAVNVDDISTVMSMYEVSEVSVEEKEVNRLYEYVDSNSDSSDNTAVCDGDNAVVTLGTTLPDVFNLEDQTVCDSNDLQYDSFVDIGKF